MKKFVLIVSLLSVSLTMSADLKDILGGLGSIMGKGSSTGTTNTESTTTTTTTPSFPFGNSQSSSSSSSSSTAGNILSGLSSLGSALGLTSSQVDVNYLQGTWKYSSPAITFQSDDLLKKAGGALASSQIENKLATYYDKLGFKNLVFTVNADSTFTLEVKKIKLSGTVKSTGQAGTITLAFKPVGSFTAFVAAQGSNTMTMTFDVSKLIDIISKVSNVIGNSTLSTVSNLLSSFDGLNAGFKLTKQ